MEQKGMTKITYGKTTREVPEDLLNRFIKDCDAYDSEKSEFDAVEKKFVGEKVSWSWKDNEGNKTKCTGVVCRVKKTWFGFGASIAVITEKYIEDMKRSNTFISVSKITIE